jgi:hypothetical protein
MKVIIENLALCEDCTFAAVNDDYSGLDYHYTEKESEIRYNEITTGLTKLGSGLCYDSTREDDEFSTRTCDCCKTRLAGKRVPFIVVVGE